jgi:putative ABC transport system permease protein
MLRVALKMLVAERAKYAGLLFGIAFTSFLITFAASYFCGFMTRGFALIAENAAADVWIMDPAVSSVEQTINMPWSALSRIRGVEGVLFAVPLVLGTAEARFPDGHFQSFEVIGVDDASLTGVPELQNGLTASVLRIPDSVIADPGGTDGKLATPRLEQDQWPHGPPHLFAPQRQITEGDELLVGDHRVRIVARSQTLPRFPPRPLLYTTSSNASRILPRERQRLTFVLATAAPGVDARRLAGRIQERTGLRARSADDFRLDTVWWFLENSEDVGDIATMICLAITVGFGVTGVMLYMFTTESLKQYATLKAMGATSRTLLTMVAAQAALCGLLGTGLGMGLCGIASPLAVTAGYPFRMMWFTPLLGGLMVILVCTAAALISARPLLKLHPAVVFVAR